MSYIPNTDLERKQMLDVVGIKHLDDLFTVVPQNLKVECLDLLIR
jgi:glycine cleavage system pyridoxal-binding protein P